MKNKLLIIGASGHGKVVADIAIKSKVWDEICFLDDNNELEIVMGIKVIGPSQKFAEYINEYDIFVGIGNNHIRKKLLKSLELAGASIPILIHPTASIGNEVNLGIGTVVMAGAVINSCTSIGKGCIINTSATIDHDNIIESFVHISPGVHLAGSVKVGNCTWLGIGCIVSNNINIVENCVIGAGTIVIRSIVESGTYIGSPARRLFNE